MAMRQQQPKQQHRAMRATLRVQPKQQEPAPRSNDARQSRRIGARRRAADRALTMGSSTEIIVVGHVTRLGLPPGYPHRRRLRPWLHRGELKLDSA